MIIIIYISLSLLEWGDKSDSIAYVVDIFSVWLFYDICYIIR